MMNALDLFSGYGGITLALEGYARPVLYCEIEKYAQGILVSRMEEGYLPFAPIWNDVTTLDGNQFGSLVDIVYGGFPCQDISTAGKGKGLDGQRSGLFKEIIRLCQETSPTFIFLENVPAIRTRGSFEVQKELARIGYDSRWCVISAASVGANHQRDRWFCLASNANSKRVWIQSGRQFGKNWEETAIPDDDGKAQHLANPNVSGCRGKSDAATKEDHQGIRQEDWRPMSAAADSSWWATEPGVGRVANGVKERTHRIKALGNGVVPLQVRIAFELLMGVL